MPVVVRILACILVGYVFGCFSTAYFVGKLYGVDIRKEGSGNLGSTNALRTLGKKAAIMTFTGDILKAVIPICTLRCILGGAYTEWEMVFVLWMGMGVVLGHNFPFWLNFKGGKGIAVTAAVILVTAHWTVMVVGLLLFVLIVFFTRYVSVGSMVVAFYLFANTMLYHRDSDHFVHMVFISLLFAGLAIFQHRGNIVRLLNGTERKVGEKKTEERV